MNKKSFNDGVRDEVLAKIIDDTLNFKTTAKNRNIKTSLFKIIPAVAAIALVIGLINILPAFVNNADDINGETVREPGVYTNPVNANNTEEKIDVFLPAIAEKSFFEDRILAIMPEGRARDRITAYYTLGSINNYSWEDIADGIITTYLINNNTAGQLYLLDSNISTREINELLGYLREYTDLTGNDIIQMYEDSGVSATEAPDPYAHVRFGDTRNTLLLDIEWHTYETYMAEMVEPDKKWLSEYMESNDYLEMSDEEKEKFVGPWNENIKIAEEWANKIKDENVYLTRTINGKSREEVGGLRYDKSINWAGYSHISGIDSNGYYTFEIFPINIQVCYWDENGDFHNKQFNNGMGSNGCPILINSQSEYEKILKDKIIPFCDDLLEKGLINQYDYERYTIPNFLDYYVDLYF